MSSRVLAVAVFAAVTGCATTGPSTPSPTTVPRGDDWERSGLLIMAHGGSEDWNAAVLEAAAPLAAAMPTRIAFGMADPVTMQRGLDELEAAGVRRVAVVRLFISGESFRHRTEYLLGTRSDPPRSHAYGRDTPGEPLTPLEVSVPVELDPQGLIDGPEAAVVMLDRARTLSTTPSNEIVMLIGHGNGDDEVDARTREGMQRVADSVRSLGFHDVHVETLREDWDVRREDSERRIRDRVKAHTARGYDVVVLPFRLFGFGPYAEVLEGLSYRADGIGLLPHPAITSWIRRRAESALRNVADADREDLALGDPPR